MQLLRGPLPRKQAADVADVAAAQVSRATPANRVTPFAEPAAESHAVTETVCNEFTQRMNLPERFTVLATGAYSGQPSELRIDQSNRRAGRIDVNLSYAKGPVVLMLGAYEPTIWNVTWSPGTTVLGVLVGGYHRQQVVGLPSTTPVLVTTYEGNGPCGYFYVSSDGMETLNPVAMRVFGRGVNSVYPAKDGRAVVGDAAPLGSSFRALSTAPVAPGVSFLGPVTRNKEEGLEDLIQLGLLRHATLNDSQMFTDAMRMQGRRSAPTTAGMPETLFTPPNNAYVVVGGFTYPDGLYGAHSVIFLVPAGAPRPRGNPGHSSVYDFN